MPNARNEAQPPASGAATMSSSIHNKQQQRHLWPRAMAPEVAIRKPGWAEPILFDRGKVRCPPIALLKRDDAKTT